MKTQAKWGEEEEAEEEEEGREGRKRRVQGLYSESEARAMKASCPLLSWEGQGPTCCLHVPLQQEGSNVTLDGQYPAREEQ